MEITCNRCHQTVSAENCYCPACGLPQLHYAADGSVGQAQPEHGNETMRDASAVAWKPAIRAALMLGIPAGILSSEVAPTGRFSLLWMTAAASLAVVFYVRNQKPAWITAGAGARIGLVTGILAGWLAFSISGSALYEQRYFFHQSSQIDAGWKAYVDEYSQASQQMTQSWTSGMSAADTAQLQANQAGLHAWMLSPWGHAGFVTFGFIINAVFLILFAVVGGALGARMLVRLRRPEV